MILRITIVAALLLLCGCPPQPRQGEVTGSPTVGTSTVGPKYPIQIGDRPFKDVHASVKEAWRLTEVAYFVVNTKYASQTSDTKDNITKEIDEQIFGVNDKVEALFKEAIKAEPDNPLNHAAYAIYLKPRKRLADGGYKPAWDDAVKEIDAAVKLWPDESSFYVTKIYLLTAPHQAHEWMRAGALEDVAVYKQLEEVDKLFDLAEKYDPDNSFLNYWHAQLLFRYTPQEEQAGIKAELLREIRAGNLKSENWFLFGAPVPPRNKESRAPLLAATDTEALYIDQWYQFGNYSRQTINAMVDLLLADLKWPRDKEQIADLMYFYYALGRTIPYDGSYFAMQKKVLEHARFGLDPKSAEASKLASAARYLDDQYITVGNKLFALRRITDPAKVNELGINELEERLSRQMDLEDNFQAPQAAVLKKWEELLDIDFPLPEDPEEW